MVAVGDSPDAGAAGAGLGAGVCASSAALPIINAPQAPAATRDRIDK